MASDGRSVSYAYDSQGRLVEVTRPDGVHHYQWDGWLLSQVIDASGVAQCVNNKVAIAVIPHRSALPVSINDPDGTAPGITNPRIGMVTLPVIGDGYPNTR